MSCECRACSWTLSGHGTVRAIDAASRPWQLSPAPGFLLSASDAMPPRDVLRLRRDLAFVNVVNGRELHPARRAAHPARRDRRCWRECIDATAPTRLRASRPRKATQENHQLSVSDQVRRVRHSRTATVAHIDARHADPCARRSAWPAISLQDRRTCDQPRLNFQRSDRSHAHIFRDER